MAVHHACPPDISCPDIRDEEGRTPFIYSIPIYGHLTMCYTHIWSQTFATRRGAHRSCSQQLTAMCRAWRCGYIWVYAVVLPYMGIYGMVILAGVTHEQEGGAHACPPTIDGGGILPDMGMSYGHIAIYGYMLWSHCHIWVYDMVILQEGWAHACPPPMIDGGSHSHTWV